MNKFMSILIINLFLLQLNAQNTVDSSKVISADSSLILVHQILGKTNILHSDYLGNFYFINNFFYKLIFTVM